MDSAIEIASAASERDPRKAKYGIILFDRLRGVSTTYTALWFATHAEIAEYFTKSFAILDCWNHDKEALLKEIAPLIQKVLEMKVDGYVLDALNQHGGGGQTLAWWGTFKQLCSVEGDVPRYLVAQYRDEYKDDFEDEEAAVKPIKSSEIDEFIVFLSKLKNW